MLFLSIGVITESNYKLNLFKLWLKNTLNRY